MKFTDNNKEQKTVLISNKKNKTVNILNYKPLITRRKERFRDKIKKEHL